MSTTIGRCAACAKLRPLAELLAFWPLGARAVVRYVCRPALAAMGTESCFRQLVGPATVHAIAPAADLAERAA